jgi:protein-S-isoprenylcysteine O-methyltransferase Ste14
MNPLVVLSFVFAFSELLLMFARHSRKKTTKSRKDSGSMILIWIIITLGFISGFFLSKPVNQFFLGAGFALIFGGIIYRWAAIMQLGKSFTVDVAITNAAKLKTDGIYGRVRHPSYLGLLLIVVGFSVTMNSFYSFLVLPVPVFLAISYRIFVEEKLMVTEFGESYVKYKAVTKKLIPGIY